MTVTWTTIVAAALISNAVLGLAYRIWRRTRGGPVADVWGQAILGVLLLLLAAALQAGWAWARWAALGYALLFGVIVMPLWVLAVLIPLEPRRPDLAFTVVYWLGLLTAGIGTFLL